MSDFEREIVSCLNRFFRMHNIPGFAYRQGRQRSASRSGNVLVDSPHPSWYCSIECRSIIDKKLYFTQHFHADNNRLHPVDAISDLLRKSGRTGFLAIEFRQGPQMEDEAFLIPWREVTARFRHCTGISREDARSCIVLTRSKHGYVLGSANAK